LRQLPDAATLDRTEGVIKRHEHDGARHPRGESVPAFRVCRSNGFTNATNAGIAFTTAQALRRTPRSAQSAGAIAAALTAKYSQIQDAYIRGISAAAGSGLGQIGGFKLQIEDRGNQGPDELYRQTQNVLAKARQRPELAGLFTGFQVNVPQIQVDVDREKLKAAGVNVQDLFDTMQCIWAPCTSMTSTASAATYQVNAQAESGFRLSAEDIGRLKTRNQRGDMFPSTASSRYARPPAPTASRTTTATRPRT